MSESSLDLPTIAARILRTPSSETRLFNPSGLPLVDDAADRIPLSLGAVPPTQGKKLAVMQVSGGSQSFKVERYRERRESADALSGRVSMERI